MVWRCELDSSSLWKVWWQDPYVHGDAPRFYNQFRTYERDPIPL